MNKELRSTLSSQGVLQLTVENNEIRQPAAHEVVVEIHAAPINPSDVAVLFGLSNMITPAFIGTTADPKVMQYPASITSRLKGRWDKSLPSGNEAGGIVTQAGADAQHLLGKVVSVFGANAFSKYRTLPAQACMVMKEGTTPMDAAASCVNPLTVLGMVETMKLENHTAIINTAAASNLGQMLVKVCASDGIPLINIVRRQEQVDLLKGISAQYVLNSSSDTFRAELIEAIKETGATLAFDAIGGGEMAGELLDAMEQAILSKSETYSVYGSTTVKQVYIYGGLSQQPTPLSRSYGMYWSVGGWLVSPIIQKLGPAGFQKMKDRIADEIHTTFKSNFHEVISMEQACEPDYINEYVKATSGKKYVVNPQL